MANTKFRDLTGLKFGRWTVLNFADRRGAENRRHWFCVCECGKSRIVDGRDLTKSQSKSCGCWRDEQASIRQMRPKNAPLPLWQEHASEYRAWANMMQRCKNEDRPDYHYYGGRGIEVCRQWANGDGDKTGFECFLEDLGKRP